MLADCHIINVINNTCAFPTTTGHNVCCGTAHLGLTVLLNAWATDTITTFKCTQKPGYWENPIKSDNAHGLSDTCSLKVFFSSWLDILKGETSCKICRIFLLLTSPVTIGKVVCIISVSTNLLLRSNMSMLLAVLRLLSAFLLPSSRCSLWMDTYWYSSNTLIFFTCEILFKLLWLTC